ncbi:PAP2 domain-containing protein [Paracoccidioides lutzii Pb01]|uniref:Dolichyldiphosphatase n=1 Tax=Paracoccidioides lutzii (strain ATCC MYA-826 / Pb01) TaxID=502779 RepID=C1H1F5_PARBA|nr:PAP2 domain-containing protein [Paracoccidioides lutzii Pb01]EEH33549.1 PAP2 domain-containing protein [Paracoccidioides lutzii Pb01]
MEVPLASLSLTHVNYNPEDPLSYVSALLSLAPQAICVIYLTLIWATREVEVLFMFAGQMLCEAINFLLKRIIREERPQQIYGKGYGMPSSHSQFVAFFSLSLTFFLLVRHVPDTSSTCSPSTYTQRAAVAVLACACACAVAISRIYLNYHTPRQVVAGFVAGVVCSVLWFWFSSQLRQWGWVDWALETRLARMARMRDLLVREDLVEAGWQRWEEKRLIARRAAKASGKIN